MRFSGCVASRVVMVVAILTSVVSAYSFDGLGSGALSQNLDDTSFFPGQALTMGTLNASDRYASSSAAASYSECLGCAADAGAVEFASPVFVEPFVAAPFVYDNFATFTTFEWPGYSYVYDSWVPARRHPVARFVNRVRPVRRVLSRVRNIVSRDFDYCRPAYVCDPCWSCADVCDPCAIATDVCDPCALTAGFAPVSVFAPRPCCGYGYYPGEVNELDSKTGLAKNKGIAAAADSASDETTAPALVPKTISTDDGDDVQESDPNLQYDSTKDLNTKGLGSAVDEGGSAQDVLETVPTPAPNLKGSGVIRMLVPENAVVYVNGYRTKQKGDLRSFAARELEIGQTYTFEVRVVASIDGALREEVKNTTLVAGETASLAFDFRGDEVYALNR